jgi:hypothetical protein
VGVTAQQVKLVLRRPDRAFDAAQRVPLEEILDAGQSGQQLVSGRCEALTQCRRLRGDVVAAAGHHEIGVLGGESPQPGQDSHGAVAHHLERLPNLQLLDVLGEVARRHALVDVLGAGERSELVDARLHIVTRDLLPLGDRGEVDVVDHCLVRLDDAVGGLDPEVPLGLEDRDPQPALQPDLVLGRPDLRDRWGCVPAGQHVGRNH